MKKLLLFIVFCSLTIGFGAWFYSGKEDKRPTKWSEALRAQLGASEYESIDKNKPLDEQISIVQIGERTFAIPTVYIQTNLRDKRKHRAINLLYVMPDFTSRGEFKNREEYMQAKKAGRMAHMLIEDVTTETSLDFVLSSKMELGKMTKFEGVEYGLEKHIDHDDPRHLNIKYQDTYVEKDESGDMISLIDCTPDGKRPYPGCSHDFDDKGLRYSIYFNKAKYLPTWRDHRRKAIAFIDGFEISNTNTQGQE